MNLSNYEKETILLWKIPKKWLKVKPPRILSEKQRAVLEEMNQKRWNGRNPDAPLVPIMPL